VHEIPEALAEFKCTARAVQDAFPDLGHFLAMLDKFLVAHLLVEVCIIASRGGVIQI
jgi:hypothetical protein